MSYRRHYHVIRNTEGYLPETDPIITTSWKAAHAAAVEEIRYMREGEWDISLPYRRTWNRTDYSPETGFAMWRGSRKDKYALDIVVTIDKCDDSYCWNEYLDLMEKGFI